MAMYVHVHEFLGRGRKACRPVMLPTTEGILGRVIFMRFAAFTCAVLGALFSASAQAQSTPYYRDAPAVASLPPPGVPPLPQWALAPPGDKPVMGAVDKGPGLDGPNIHDLAARGYVEQEYILTGSGNIYTAGGAAIAEANVP